IAALRAQGLAGKVPVSGQDGDKAALNRVALGEQTVDVWKDARLLGKTAGEAAMQLCKNSDSSKVTGTAKFTTPGNNSLSSILLRRADCLERIGPERADRHHGPGDGRHHGVPHQLALDRIEVRVPRLHDGDVPGRMDRAGVRDRTGAAVHLDPDARRWGPSGS